jgi:hypothetical protein
MPTAARPTTPSTSTTRPAATTPAAKKKGLSHGATIGIGVGVAVGIVAVIIGGLIACSRCGRQSRSAEPTFAPPVQQTYIHQVKDDTPGTSNPLYGGGNPPTADDASF